MLSTNKPSMDKNLKALYDVLEDAAYEGYLKAEGYDDVDSQIDDLELQNKPDKGEIKKKMEDTAKLFSNEFIKQLKAGKLLETISDEIDSHVKAIADGLMITMMPQGIATIIAPPSGPCTGSMVISSSTAQINLL
jgi:hypothetical protein